MSSEWYYARGGKQSGPVSLSDLRNLAATGALGPADMVWKEGMADWKAAGSIPGLIVPAASAGKSASDGQPASVQDTQPRIKIRAKEAVGMGLSAVQTAMHSGTVRLRETFGGAMKETISSSIVAFRELLTHPVQYAFGTFVLLIACALSIPGLVTVLLIPVFVLGYIPYVKSVLKREPASLGAFIGFMRHGWDSLWHLMMLLAAFFVAVAIAVAPLLIVAASLYFALGTVTLGATQAMSVLPAQRDSSDEGAPRRDQVRQNDVEPDAKDGFFTHVTGAVKYFGEAAAWAVGLVALGVMFTILLTPSGSILILIYCIVLMVATTSAGGDAKYDLVYQAFERMLRIAQRQWKRLVISGLCLVCIPIAFNILTTIAASTLASFRLSILALWFPLVLYPAAVLAFVIYANIFAVQTAMQLVEGLEADLTPQ